MSWLIAVRLVQRIVVLVALTVVVVRCAGLDVELHGASARLLWSRSSVARPVVSLQSPAQWPRKPLVR